MGNDNRGRDIFYGVVAVATLIVAIIGATLAYFSVTASSNEVAINATADRVSIDYLDGSQVTAQADKLIPAKFDIVKEVYETRFYNGEEGELTEDDFLAYLSGDKKGNITLYDQTLCLVKNKTNNTIKINNINNNKMIK